MKPFLNLWLAFGYACIMLAVPFFASVIENPTLNYSRAWYLPLFGVIAYLTIIRYIQYRQGK